MRDEWIQGRFEGVYSGRRVPGDGSDPPGARRFSFEIESGEVTDLQLIPAPLETDAPGEPKEIRQARVKRVSLPLMEGDAPRERPLFDVRVRDWKLLHPAEQGERSFGTLVGTLEARLSPPSPALEPMRVGTPAREIPRESDAALSVPSVPRRLASPTLPGRSHAVEGTEAAVVYARVRWALALSTLLLGGALFGLACGSTAAVTWSAPIALALTARAVARRFATPPSRHTWRLHGWAGAALLLAAAIAWSEPLLGWWRTACGVAALPDLPWLAVPVVVAGLLRARWPLALAVGGWGLLVCATCWSLGGACTAGVLPPDDPAASLASRARPPAARAGSSPSLAREAAPRTGPDGHWPVVHARAPVGPSLSGIADRLRGGGGYDAAGSLAGSGGGASAAGLEAGSEAERGPTPVPMPEAAREPAPQPQSQPALPSQSQPPPRFAATQSTPGGWVSPDHRRAERELVRISVEHANRSPAEFFGEARRRVYIPADSVFEPGATRVRKQGELELSRLANLLSLHPERRALLEVHTDAGGSPEAQRAVSQRQAAAIHDWLTARGHLASKQLQVVGQGGSMPIVPPDGSHAAQKPNRRIELQLLD